MQSAKDTPAARYHDPMSSKPSDVFWNRAETEPRAAAAATAAVQEQGVTVLFTGLSSAGKSTLASAVYERLRSLTPRVELLDAGQIRATLCPDLKYSRQDREENLRRIGFVAGLLSRHNVVTLIAAIAPYRESREQLRQSVDAFVEVFVDASLAVCEQRDRLGLYRRFRAGEISSISGIDSPYEPPLHPDVHCRTEVESIEESAMRVVDTIVSRMR